MLDRSIQPADPLSDILSLLKPHSVACGAIDAGDVCISFPGGPGIKCHAVIAGEAWLEVDGVAKAVHLTAGDCFVLPHRGPYRLASDLRLSPTDYRVVLAGRLPNRILVWNGGGQATIISATFTIDERHATILLGILPPIVHVQHDDADRTTLRRSLLQMMQELGDPQAGSRLIVEHLATMILAQALRAYAMRAGNSQVGWLFALADSKIGRAIGAMHEDPAKRWTVESLAKRAGMSRTSFAVHFRRSVGSAPMIYMTHLRMLLACDRLINSNDTLAVVAEAYGYASQSAFSAAFKRHLGLSPRQHISHQKTT